MLQFLMRNLAMKHAVVSDTMIMMIGQQRYLHRTAPLFAEPLRKRKAINPLTTKKQFERKIRRLEREIAKLESIEPKLKPILELTLQPDVKKNLDARKRQNDENDDVSRRLLNSYLRVWSILKAMEAKAELRQIDRAARAQERSLNVLKRDYPELYEAAIELDPQLIPYRVSVVKKQTPPAPDHCCPDGKQIDITKQWKL